MLTKNTGIAKLYEKLRLVNELCFCLLSTLYLLCLSASEEGCGCGCRPWSTGPAWDFLAHRRQQLK